MKVICPNCKEVIDVKQDDKYGYCKHCSNQFVTSDALNLLVKQYKKINNYAKTQLFTNLNVDEAFSAYKSLLKLRPNDLNAITGMADCYFLGSTLDNFKGEEVINLFEEYDITLDRENSYLILNYMLEIMKYCRIYFREAERTKKDNKFIRKEYEEWFKKNNESISKLLEYVDSIIPLVDKEELDTFRNDEQPQFNENFKALQTQCEENKAKVFECLNENEHELEDKRIITPNKKLNKLRKYCFIGITICAVIFLVLLITGIATKINILSYLSIIPALGIGVIFYIFYRKTK
ncbi:MAG: hypothetical protein PUF99_03740 [Bacilli bacterium]|nr:hypothetical protein [Bacilli bacterium]